MFRVFSTAVLILLCSSGCATLLVHDLWALAPEAVVPTDEVRVVVVPPAERVSRARQDVVFEPRSTESGVGAQKFSPSAVSAAQVVAAETRTPATTVRVYYGTNRPQLNEPSGIHYGTVDVSIPARHQFGELERPSLWRLEFRESAEKHVLLKSVTPLPGDRCLDQLRGDLARTRSPDLFIFIHGYNVTFEEAAMRTGQMTFDLRYEGIPLFFSWPSRGHLTGYGSDLMQADRSASDLAEFLTRVAQESGARQVHLVAHSMGNRALVGALTQISGTNSGTRFDQVVFAAPDLDAGQFASDIAPRIRPVVRRATIYSSGSDLALWASRLWNRTVRLGQPGRYLSAITGLEWVDVIDVTAVGFDWFELGHSAYGSELLVDLDRVLEGRPAGVSSDQPGTQTWSVARPSPRTPAPIARPGPVYRIRPERWPTAPVDRFR